MAEVGRFRSEVMCDKQANNSVQLIKCSAEIGRFANISIGIEGGLSLLGVSDDRRRHLGVSALWWGRADLHATGIDND
jgi:hypothetical protein